MEAQKTGYALSIEMDLPYEQAIERVMAALKEQGFGVLTEIDVKKTLKEKLDVDFRKYVILGACNPPLAYEAFTNQLDIGLLLPCNVIVYEKDSGSMVSMLDPLAMLGFVKNPALDSVANEARRRLELAINNLKEL
jgi:uncharacterized protein (DUF302 family)